MFFFRAIICVLASSPLLGGIASQENAPAAKAVPAIASDSPFVGSWSYRSFRSDPNLDAPAGDLLFGKGTLTLEIPAPGRLQGSIGGDGWSLALKGGVADGNPASIRFQGKGVVDGEEWVYDYVGYLVPVWPNGVDQRPAIVGSIVRTASHSKGQAKAGVVAQWIAVRQDAAGAAGASTPSAMRMPAAAPQAGRVRSEQRLRELFLQEDERERARSRSLKSKAPKPLNTEAPQPTADPLEFLLSFSPKSSLEPSTATSSNGRLELTLYLDYGVYRIGRDRVRLRTYNGGLVGPVLRVKAGDVLAITLVNLLPPDPAAPHVVNGPHDWNTTNLHFHGLHVAPQGPRDRPNGRSSRESDNVLLELQPSNPFDPNVSVQKYEVHIPPNHPAGTFWYHAHKHGSVAAQDSSGMAGALIVERSDDVTNLDSIPEVAAAAQEIAVLQQIPYMSGVFDQLGGIELTSLDAVDGMFGPGVWPTLGRYTLVNGLRIPTFRMAPGEVRRFRFIDSGQREKISLAIEPDGGRNPPAMYEVALDGLVTGLLRKVDAVDLFPGYRSDVLVQAPVNGAGTYQLVDAALVDRNGKPVKIPGKDGSPELTRVVARIVVEGKPVAMKLPTPNQLWKQRPADLKTRPSGKQYAFYGIDLLSAKNTNFLISRKAELAPPNAMVSTAVASPYSPTDPRNLVLGRTEEWIVGSRNSSGAPGGSPLKITHPFHIHINPFLIQRVTDDAGVDRTTELFGGQVWRDTLAMEQGLTYHLVTQYADFTGSFVDHCHILDHEDNGMMELVSIIGPAAVAARPSPSVLLFVKGSSCVHCMSQLTDMASRLSERGLNVSVFSASTAEDLKAFPKVPFRLIADPQLEAFRKHGALANGKAMHATIARDTGGKEVFRYVGEEPLADAGPLMKAIGSNRAR